MAVDLDLDLQVASAAPALPTADDLARWATAALEGQRTRAELTIRLVDEAEGRALNLQYRGQDKPTNVLSFPFEAPPGLPAGEGFGDTLGDLAICAPIVQREAREQGKAAEAHWAHLVVHGVLHLLGHDHLTESEATAMETVETAILIRLGFPPPYEEAPTTQ